MKSTSSKGEMAKETWRKVVIIVLMLALIAILLKDQYPSTKNVVSVLDNKVVKETKNSPVATTPAAVPVEKPAPTAIPTTSVPVSTTPKPFFSSKIDQSKLVDINYPANITGQGFEELFVKYSESKEVDCGKSERLGKTGEGGWEMCIDPNFVPKSPCIIYSFGINNEWYFDDACDAKYTCLHRAFDPSMGKPNHRRGKNINFIAEGLAGSDKFTPDRLWRLSTLHSIRKVFGESDAVIDYLKIDVEYWEWESLLAAFKQDALRNVKQLGIEVHRDEIAARTSSMDSYKTFFKVFKGLRDYGFYKWNWHLNPFSIVATSSYSKKTIMCCYEFIFLNARYL